MPQDPGILAGFRTRRGRRVMDRRARRGTLEAGVRLLGPARTGLGGSEERSFEDEQTDGHPVTALSATKTASNAAAVRE